jgi:hypothetical protein
MEIRQGGKFKGKFEFEVYEGIPQEDGSVLQGKIISKTECHNIITDEGLNRMLNVFLDETTQTATWYCGLFENDFTPDGDETYDVPAFTESTSYDEAARPAYVPAASTAKSTANKAVFTASATKTFYGAFLTSVATKGDHASGANNVLFCAGKFTTAQPVIDGNVCNLTYTVTAADDGV